MRALLMAKPDPRPYFGFSLLALLIVLGLCARWYELTAGLSNYRVGCAMWHAVSGVDFRGSTRGACLEAWLAGEACGQYVSREAFAWAAKRYREKGA